MLLNFFLFPLEIFNLNNMSPNFISNKNGVQVACPKIFIFFPWKTSRILITPIFINLQAKLEAVHPLYSTLFNYLHYWKKMQLYKTAEQLAKIEVKCTLNLEMILRPPFD